MKDRKLVRKNLRQPGEELDFWPHGPELNGAVQSLGRDCM